MEGPEEEWIMDKRKCEIKNCGRKLLKRNTNDWKSLYTGITTVLMVWIRFKELLKVYSLLDNEDPCSHSFSSDWPVLSPGTKAIRKLSVEG